jgi:hypothetical protein
VGGQTALLCENFIRTDYLSYRAEPITSHFTTEH